MAIAEAGPDPEVALEACYGWYWAADLLQAEGARVHLVHPLGLHWDTRRVKNDVKDATELANRLRRNDLPEAWIAPPEVRELRELVRYRAKLVALAHLGQGPDPRGDGQAWGSCRRWTDMFGPGGQALLDQMPFEGAYALAGGVAAGPAGDLRPGAGHGGAGDPPPAAKTTPATGPSRPCTGSGRSWPPSSWPRSATSPASPPPGICARGRA